MASNKKTYPETSMERAAYLAVNGVYPDSGEWNYDDQYPLYIFRYPHTEKLGKLLLEYKSSKFNTLIGIYTAIFHARGKKLKQRKSYQNFEDKEMDLASIVRDYKNPYDNR